jgi:hypothetical protein
VWIVSPCRSMVDRYTNVSVQHVSIVTSTCYLVIQERGLFYHEDGVSMFLQNCGSTVITFQTTVIAVRNINPAEVRMV